MSESPFQHAGQSASLSSLHSLHTPSDMTVAVWLGATFISLSFSLSVLHFRRSRILCAVGGFVGARWLLP